MARAGLTPAAVVDAAIGLIDEDGPRALTLAAVAARAGVATPSLYKHVKGLPELRTLVAVRIMNELCDRVTEAVIGHSGAAGVRALMLAQRQYALDFPSRYNAMPQHTFDDEDWLKASNRLLTVILSILDGCGVSGSEAVHLTRCIRATTHGFVTLQTAGGFQLAENVDETYERLIGMVTASLP